MRNSKFIQILFVLLVAQVSLISWAADHHSDQNQFKEWVIAIPTSLPGYFEDQELPVTSEGLYKIKGWIRTGEKVVIQSDQDLPKTQNETLDRIAEVFRSLLFAYKNGDFSTVQSLYESSSREKLKAMLSESEAMAGWIKSIQMVESFELLMVWEKNTDFIVLSRVGMRLETGELAYAPMHFGLSEQFQLITGDATEEMNNNLSRYFTDPSRQPSGLIANWDYLKDE